MSLRNFFLCATNEGSGVRSTSGHNLDYKLKEISKKSGLSSGIQEMNQPIIAEPMSECQTDPIMLTIRENKYWSAIIAVYKVNPVASD
jgi:hypothetical protein